MFGNTFLTVVGLLLLVIVLEWNGVGVVGVLTNGQTFTGWVASFADTNDLDLVGNAFDKVGNL